MGEQGLLLIVSGPSGAGKGTVCGAILHKNANISYSVSMTTRKPREGEVHGREYFFVSKEEFADMIKHDQLLEYAEVYGNYYGTPLRYVMEEMRKGRDILLEIEMEGARQVREKFPAAVFVFILPPSMEELSSRLKNRATDDEETISVRLNAAGKEIAQMTVYDYVVINDKIDETVNKLLSIISVEKMKVSRN
jgi:guanylate kinase